MTSSPFELYIDRLKNDDSESIFASVDPSMLDLNEDELSFEDKVTISGQAYLANNHLILDLKIKATAILPCSICNQSAKMEILIEDVTQTLEICEIKSAIYNFKEDVRSNILLNVPQFVECHEGRCPHRKDLNKYLRRVEEKTHSPFSELNLTF